MEKENEKKIEILTIQTPSGEVPNAQSLKKLAEYWNSVITAINKGSESLNRDVSDINEQMRELSQMAKSQAQKINILTDSVRELRVRVKTIAEELQQIREEISRLEGNNYTNDSIEETAREILFKKDEKEE